MATSIPLESPAIRKGGGSPGIIARDESEDPMMALKWFHPHLTRHAADCMLIDNAPEGAFLMRQATDNDGYVLSVKLSSSVQHIRVGMSPGHKYRFGNSSFNSVDSLRKHFEQAKPVIGSDSGVTVVLKYPYRRDVDEAHMYTDVVHHAVTHMVDTSDSDSESEGFEESDSRLRTLAVSSKEGYLTKLGGFVKTWRVRWFVLRNNYLSYYKTKQSHRAKRTLDISLATAVEFDNSKHKDYCFRLELPKRTFFFYANSAEDCQHWVDLLRSKLPLS